jgi:hypothetical protein
MSTKEWRVCSVEGRRLQRQTWVTHSPHTVLLALVRRTSGLKYIASDFVIIANNG